MVSEATYRFELASTGRALCRNTACKNNEIKILKGEFRMGTLVVIKEHSSWHWKHWGCVTPKQIANLQSQMEGLDFDNDKDLEILDGFEDLDEESREKLREALKVGHVADEDWKGTPELNRPGMKGINKRTPKKKAASEEAENAPEMESPAKTTKPKNAKAVKDEPEISDVKPAKASKKRKADAENQIEADLESAPKKVKKSKATVKQEEDDTTEIKPTKKSKAVVKHEDSEASDVKPAKKTTKSRSKKTTAPAEEAIPTNGLVDGATDEAEIQVSAPAKKGRKPKVKAEVERENDGVSMEDVPTVADGAPRRSGRKPRAKT